MSNTSTSATPKSPLNNTQYDFLKALAQYVLPAAGVLYVALAGYWHLPHPTEVVGTITAVDTFLGVILGVLKSNYLGSGAAYDGAIHILSSAEEGVALQKMEITTPVNDILGQDSVTLKVNNTAG